MAVALCCSIVVLCLPESYLHRMIYNIKQTYANEPTMFNSIEKIDQIFNSLPKNGNVFLRFSGFNPQNDHDRHVASRYYYRATYTLYPRDVVIYPSNDKRVEMSDILSLPSSVLTDELIDSLKIKVILTVGKDAEGLIYYDLKEIY
ncbi:hypothetical protein JYT61_00805 [bacterium AH-315-E10]|nr:hypothetical protein [bacterium AH-315-E10]